MRFGEPKMPTSEDAAINNKEEVLQKGETELGQQKENIIERVNTLQKEFDEIVSYYEYVEEESLTQHTGRIMGKYNLDFFKNEAKECIEICTKEGNSDLSENIKDQLLSLQKLVIKVVENNVKHVEKIVENDEYGKGRFSYITIAGMCDGINETELAEKYRKIDEDIKIHLMAS